jgi:diguanylate cyclase (GGDEF)-like protein
MIDILEENSSIKVDESPQFLRSDPLTALVLLEEANARVYRIGGDEFVGVITGGTAADHPEHVELVSARLNREASQVKLNPPAAILAMIHYTGLEEISPKDVLGVIYGAFIELKRSEDHSFKVFDAATTLPARDLSGLINDMVRRMISLGYLLDKSQELAYTDSITGLPNMHAALLELRSALERGESDGTSFTILLVDGDDLRRYNKIGYLAGDEMIQRLGATLQAELRPGDFLARWRTGDEFFVLLQESMLDDAIAIAERLKNSVREASEEWTFPITISLGIAGYPQQGDTAKELLHRAEEALGQAKIDGKDQVVIASG